MDDFFTLSIKSLSTLYEQEAELKSEILSQSGFPEKGQPLEIMESIARIEEEKLSMAKSIHKQLQLAFPFELDLFISHLLEKSDDTLSLSISKERVDLLNQQLKENLSSLTLPCKKRKKKLLTLDLFAQDAPHE